ncbi:MAG TPA: helix-turn-helix domain-containing protein [Terracidiphilus sp.]|nr:helix-turn-helix domain-containing protein [Terracidiphilus sp.]
MHWPDVVSRKRFFESFIIENIYLFSIIEYDLSMKQTCPPFVVQGKKQLSALASSARQEIVDVLSQMGTVSVGELAAALGRPADALYYHLRVLRQAGLVIRAGYRGQGVHKEELIRTVSSDLQLQYRPGKGGNGQQINAIVGSMLRLGIRDFHHAFESGDTLVSGSGRELWALRKTGWLTPEEIVNMNQLIEGLAKTVSKPRGQGRLYGITVLLTPLDHRARASSKKSTSRKWRGK